MEGQSAGLAARLVSSRKTCSDRSRYQGLANACSAPCKAGANAASAAWLYEMKASYFAGPGNGPSGVVLFMTRRVYIPAPAMRSRYTASVLRDRYGAFRHGTSPWPRLSRGCPERC
jgi:hypothetical protein